MSLEQPISTTPPVAPPPISRDSPGMESDYCSDYGSLSSSTDPLSSDSHRHVGMSVKSEELGVLEQLMALPGSEFGFVLDRNGTIEAVLGKTQSIFGNVQIENQKLLKFVAPTEYQKVCGLLPSAKSSSARKSSTLTFSAEKTKANTQMEIVSQLINGNSDNPEKGPCVVCVAKRLISETMPHASVLQNSRQPVSFSLAVDKASRIIKQADLRIEPKLLDMSHFLEKSLYDLSFNTKRDIIDTLVDANSPCQAKLTFNINEYQLFVDVSNFIDPNSTQVRLECNGNYELSSENFKEDKNDTIFLTQPPLEVVTQHPTVATTTTSVFSQQQFVQAQSFDMQLNNEVEHPAKKPRKPRKPRSPSASAPKRSRAKKTKDSETSQAWNGQYDDSIKNLAPGPAFHVSSEGFYYSPAMGPPPPYGALNQTMGQTAEPEFADVKPKSRSKKSNKKNSTTQPIPNQHMGNFVYQNSQISAEVQQQFINGYAIHQEFPGISNNHEMYGNYDPTTSMSSQVANNLPHHPTVPQGGSNTYPNNMTMNGIHMNAGFHSGMNPGSGHGPPQSNWSGNMPNSQADFHQMYQAQQQNVNMQMGYSQPPNGMNTQQTMMQMQQQQQQQKKGGQKRKNGQQPPPQINGRPVKQQFMGQPYQQQPQQFPQGYVPTPGMPMHQSQASVQPGHLNRNYNGQNLQQNTIGQYQNYNQQWMKDAVKRELRNTVVARQAVSPNQPPQGSNINLANDMEINRFASASSTPPNHNMLTSPRMINNQMGTQGFEFRGNMPPQQQHVQQPQTPMQVSQRPIMGEHTIPRPHFLPELSLDDCKSYLHGDDPSAPLSAIDTTIVDFRICEDKFDMDNEDTRKFVHKLLS